MFTNKEIDNILDELTKKCGSADYVYALYDDSYSNRPVNPEFINIIIPDDTDCNFVKEILHNYNVTLEICYGIGEVICITHK